MRALRPQWVLLLAALSLMACPLPNCDDEESLPSVPTEPISVGVSPNPFELRVGGERVLTATVHGGPGGTAGVVTWSAEPAHLVRLTIVDTLPTEATVVALAAGTATIRATHPSGSSGTTTGVIHP